MRIRQNLPLHLLRLPHLPNTGADPRTDFHPRAAADDPQTGDTFPVALLVVVVFGSIAAIGVLTYKRRKSEADIEEDDQ